MLVCRKPRHQHRKHSQLLTLTPSICQRLLLLLDLSSPSLHRSDPAPFVSSFSLLLLLSGPLTQQCIPRRPEYTHKRCLNPKSSVQKTGSSKRSTCVVAHTYRAARDRVSSPRLSSRANSGRKFAPLDNTYAPTMGFNVCASEYRTSDSYIIVICHIDIKD